MCRGLCDMVMQSPLGKYSGVYSGAIWNIKAPPSCLPRWLQLYQHLLICVFLVTHSDCGEMDLSVVLICIPLQSGDVENMLMYLFPFVFHLLRTVRPLVCLCQREI